MRDCEQGVTAPSLELRPDCLARKSVWRTSRRSCIKVVVMTGKDYATVHVGACSPCGGPTKETPVRARASIGYPFCMPSGVGLRHPSAPIACGLPSETAKMAPPHKCHLHQPRWVYADATALRPTPAFRRLVRTPRRRTSSTSRATPRDR